MERTHARQCNAKTCAVKPAKANRDIVSGFSLIGIYQVVDISVLAVCGKD
jgi:hypothetical protein